MDGSSILKLGPRTIGAETPANPRASFPRPLRSMRCLLILALMLAAPLIARAADDVPDDTADVAEDYDPWQRFNEPMYLNSGGCGFRYRLASQYGSVSCATAARSPIAHASCAQSTMPAM